MGSKYRTMEGLDKAYDAAVWVSQRWPWFGRLLLSKREVCGVAIDGFSVRHDGLLWVVVVRGMRLEPLEFVVAIGRAERLYDALRNVTSTINKGTWAKDKYRSL